MLSHDAVKLLKTQDSGYLQTMIQKTRKAREKLEGEFVLTHGRQEGSAEVDVLGGKSGKGEKVVFVENEGEQRGLYDGNADGGPTSLGDEEKEKESISGDELLSIVPKSRKLIQREEALRKEAALLRKQHRKEQNARRSKLEALKVREKDLRDAENELELQRAKMSNTIGGSNKNGVKWKPRERKK